MKKRPFFLREKALFFEDEINDFDVENFEIT